MRGKSKVQSPCPTGLASPTNLLAKRTRSTLYALMLLTLLATSALAAQRFPPPDFESGHKLPLTTAPAAREIWFQYLDIAVLAASLGIATWLVFRKRSRKGLMALSVFSILYFGFWRKGCVCAIGSVQNVALGLADHSYAVPIVVTAFFVLPLLFALFAGRTFCAGVCPHGALQDWVLLKPLKLPPWLEHGAEHHALYLPGGGCAVRRHGQRLHHLPI